MIRASLLAVVLASSAAVAQKTETPRPEPPKGVTFAGGDGGSCDRPVVIRGASGAEPATLAQIAWLRTHHPGYKFKDNDLESRGGRKLETITIETGGRTLPVCFDITESFETGKLR
jgi:hypothetical protein